MAGSGGGAFLRRGPAGRGARVSPGSAARPRSCGAELQAVSLGLGSGTPATVQGHVDGAVGTSLSGGSPPLGRGPPRPRGGILVLGHCSSGTVPRPCSPRVSQPPWGPRTDEPGVGHPRPLSRVSQASVSRRVQMPNEHKPPHLPNQHSAPYQQKGHRREEFDSWPCVPVRGWVSPGACFAVGSSTPRVFREW